MRQYFYAYVTGSCPNGHYCPSPGDERPCPKGFFNPNTGSTSHEACVPCTPGSYCATEGLSAPTGPCSPGWYCVGIDTTPTPLGKECSPGHYCPEGTSDPLPCPVGTYQANYGESTCTACPIGYYCMDQGLAQTSGVCDDGWVCEESSSFPRPTMCPKGHACSNGVKTICPAGTFQDSVKQSECRPCIIGSYCETAGLTAPTGTCATGWYCYQGETKKMPPGQLCPKGHMCTEGIKYACRSGTYRDTEGQKSCTPCPVSHYCDGPGLTAPTAVCELGQCCQTKFKLPSTCNQGEFLHLTFSTETRPTFSEAKSLCISQGGYTLAEIDTNDEYNRLMTWFLTTSPYVVSGVLNLPAGIWLGPTWGPSGYVWNLCNNANYRHQQWGIWAPGEDPITSSPKCLIMDTSHQFANVDCDEKYDILCEKCSDCGSGYYKKQNSCVKCEKGFYCEKPGLFAQSGPCLPGFSCTKGATAPDKTPCLQGRYCAAGFKQSCMPGEYQPSYGSTDCLPCPAGRYCDDIKLGFPSGVCSEGSYCPAGTETAYGISCPIGHRCPTGSGVPTACESGTYQNAVGAGLCLPCPEGKYCDKTEAEAEQQSGTNSPTHGVVTPKSCPELIYCRIGSANAVCDDDPYEPGSVSVTIQCNPNCNQTQHRFKEMTFTAICPDCSETSSYVWSLRQCVGQNLADCHNCIRWIHYVNDNDSPTFIYNRMWSTVDVTGWEYYLVVVKVTLENGDEGQAYKMIEYVIPWTDPVICTVSPYPGSVVTLFDISCDPVPGADQYSIWYWLYLSDVVVGDGDQPNFENIALPAGAEVDDNFVYLQTVATITNDTFYTSLFFSVQVFSPVNGGYTEWSAWSSCTLTCGTGSQTRSRDCTNPAPQHGGVCVGDSTETQDCNTNPCAIDGGFTEWTTWGSCTLTCGTGSQSRSRDCTNPAPQAGGSDCVGDSIETQDCNTNPCPIDGGFTVWSAWSSCPVTCGTGSQSRSRDCTNPAPQHGGSNCVGDSTEAQDCNTNMCPIDGGFTEWTIWGSCTLTCGTGSQSRSRDCTNPAPQHGGIDCVGDTTETQDCNTNPCPIDGGFTEWTAWGSCSDTCGTGSQSRSRDCTNPAPQHGGSDCVGHLTETQDCNTNPCPIDGGFTAWTAWSSCPVTCGTGSQSRSRDCTNPAPQHGGSDCVGDSTEAQDCNTNPCPIDGGFTEWTAWGSCSDTCGTGSQSRSRDCTNPAPQHGGSNCVGHLTETQDCNTNPCPIDGGFTAWTAWSSCPVTCGTGSQSRSRDCTNPAPQHGGSDCVGDSTEAQDCNTNPCPIDGGFTEWTAWGSCSDTCGTGSQSRSRDCTNPAPQHGGSNCVGHLTETQDCNTNPCPIDGGFTAWTAWSSCPVTCGTGSQSRSRDCTNPAPQHGGSDCVGDSTEAQDCNTNPCPIDGGFTEWTAWGSCSDTCGTGSQLRSRDCTNPAPQHGGSNCVGDSTETQDCNTNLCPIDGGFTAWTAWDSCTLTCGTGSQTRSRDCTNPVPQHGGSDCVGDSTETQDCNTNPCPIDGGFTEWTAWGSCSDTCGTGSQLRSRDCTNPAPQHGGSNCVGHTTETQDCNTNLCPIDGGFTAWTAWDSCTLTCGTGSQTRSRDCTNPVPQHGGSDCVGDSTETQDCNTNPCPIDGGFTEWTAWGSCSDTCGTGSQLRSRDCTNPAPQHGGSNCVGHTTETQDCNTNLCPIDGGFTAWTAWSSCPVTCGTGSQTRSRDCTNPVPQHGGSDCVGDSTETQDCNTNPCPIDGGFTEWTAWGSCSNPCGTGIQLRSRDCTNPAPQYGGSDCVGHLTETQDCNTILCPIDGGFTEWTAWGSCSDTCGTGSQSRSRDCTNPAPQHGGSDCVGDSTETQDCNTNPCPIDGGFTAWTAWSSCPVTCETGSQSRSRDCTNPVPQHGGSDCVGDSTETQDCNTNPCPIDGGFTEWTAWGYCSVTCGTGSLSRSRNCTNPAPQYGGSDCVGNSTETQDCNTSIPCPIDGGFTEWTTWSSCPVTCGTGNQSRSRDCINPVPQHGGSDCVGNATETQDCNTNPCPIDGGLTEWTAWGSCSDTCGTGSQLRSRDCTNPAPQHGGSNCVGNYTESQDCNPTQCPIDGGFTEWTAWSSCPATCGTGSQSRSRDCTDPVPQYGGSDCVGDSTETQVCSTIPCLIVIPSTDPVSCTISPSSGGMASSSFNISCDQASREELYSQWYWLYAFNILLYERDKRNFNNIDLPAGRLADNFYIPLRMDATVGNDTFHSQNLSIQVYPTDLYELEILQIMHFSCQPTCTSFMSSASTIYFTAICTECASSVSTYTWTMMPCDGYQVKTCTQYLSISHDLKNTRKQYLYDLATSQYDVGGWTYFGMFVLVHLTDGSLGTGHHIWKYFDPEPADSVQCSVVPPYGYSLETFYNTSCEDVQTPEPYDIVYRLYKYSIVLYQSLSPNMTNLLLPAEFLDDQSTIQLDMVARIQGHLFYRSHIGVQVKPVSLEVISKMESFVLNTFIQHMENEEIFKAVAVLDSVVESLNHEYATEEDNGTAMDEEQVKWRTYVAQSIATINTSSLELISTGCNVLNKVTQEPETVSSEFQNISTNLYSSLAESLFESLTDTKEEIPLEDITDTAGAILLGTTTMVEGLTESLVVTDKETPLSANVTVPPATDQTTPIPTPEERNRTVEMAGKLLKVMDRVCEALNNRQIEDAEPTIIMTEKVNVAVQKLSLTKVAGASIQINSSEEDSSTSVTMPEDFNPIGSAKDYSLQVVSVKKNPYMWSAKSNTIKTPAISITLKDSDNQVMGMKNLSTPLKISFPADLGNFTQSLRLKVLVVKAWGTFTQMSTFLYRSTATFKLSSTNATGLMIKMPTNLTNIKLYLTRGVKPSLEDILEHGRLYPQETGTLLEELGDNFADETNSSVIYFAPNTFPYKYDKLNFYAGVSLDLTDNQTMKVVQHLDPACLGNQTREVCVGKLEITVELKTFGVQCLYWKDEDEDWSSDGCEVSTDTNGNLLGCACDHMSFFGGGLLDLPATVDPIHDFQLIKLIENPVVVTTLILMLFVYVFLVQWARKADRQDQEKVGVIVCNYNADAFMYQYLVCVVTGWWKQAGTTANVFINLSGTLGDSSNVYLTCSSRQCFQSGNEDWFLVTTESCLGILQSVTLWHDNSGTSPHWYLDQVYIKDVNMDEFWVFICNDWLAVDRGKLRLTTVTMNALSQKEIKIRRKYHFFMKTLNNLRDEHIWISIFSKPARSTFTRVQRLTCGLSFLLTTMLTNIMFYGIPTDDPEDQLSVGVFSISIAQLIIGVKSSLLMFPVNFCTIQLFCKTRPKVKDTDLEQKEAHQSGNDEHGLTEEFYKQLFDNISSTKPFPVLKSVTKQQPSVPSIFTVYIPQTLNYDELGRVSSETPQQDDFAVGEVESIFDKKSARRRNIRRHSNKTETNAKGQNSNRNAKGQNSNRNAKGKVKGQSRKGLPWWCIYIAWFLVTLTCLTSSYFVLLYGMKYGYERSLEWLVSFLTGFWSNTLLMEPVKTVGLALVLVFVLKRSFTFDEADVDDVIRDADKVYTSCVVDQNPVHQSYIEPLSSRLLQQIRRRLKLEWSLDMALRDLFIQMMYMVVLLIIIHSQRPVTEAFMCSSTVENLFIHNTNRLPLKKVSEQNDVYSYLRLTVVPGITEVSGVDPSTVTLGSDYQLIGPYRLRQLRVKSVACDIQIPLVSESCGPAYSLSAADTGHYNTSWSQITSSENASSATDSAWRYQGSRQLNTFTFNGKLASYSGGGFVRLVSSNTEYQLDILADLETSGWMDERTRVVYLEFSLYNPNVDLFSVVVILFEFTNLGAVFPTHYIFTTSLYYSIEDLETYLVVCGLLFIVLNLLFIYLLIVKFKTLGWREYFSDFWNCAEIVKIVLSLSIIGLFIQRIVTVNSVLSDIQPENMDVFVNVYPALLIDFSLEYVMASVVSLVMIKAVKLLQFHWRSRMVTETLAKVRSAMVNYILMFFVVIMAFSHSSYLSFHTLLHKYKDLGQAIISNFRMIAGDDDIVATLTRYTVYGPLFVMVFILTVSYCLVTMYAAILNTGRVEVKDEIINFGKKVQLKNYFMSRIKDWFDVVSKKKTT